jgi:hypothetical protein
MSKFRRNLLVQISKALVNSKIQFLFQKSFFLAFGPANPAARSASGPARPPAAPSPQVEIIPAGPSSPCVGRVFAGNTFSLSDHAFPSRPPLPHLSVNWAPPVRFTPFPVPADPGQKSPAPPLPCAAAPHLGCPRAFTALPHHSPPLIPFKPSLNAFNGVKAINVGD